MSERSLGRSVWRVIGGVLVVIGLVAGVVLLNPTLLREVLSTGTSTVETPIAVGIPEGAAVATVGYVHDGDTLFLLVDGERLKVRLLAVDTPEIGDSAECFGAEATAHLRGLLPEGATVHVLPDAEPLDQYGRSLFFVWTSTGSLVNQSLVADGYAEAVFFGGNRMFETEVEAAEQAARAAGLGLWGSC